MIILIVIEEKVQLINEKKSPIIDKEIEEFHVSENLYISATSNKYDAYRNADYVIIAAPTNYDE